MSDSSQLRKPLLIVVFLLLSQVLLVLSLFAPKSLEKAIESEISMMIDVYGSERTKKIYDSSQIKSNEVLYESGFIDYLRDLLLPKTYVKDGEVKEDGVLGTGTWEQIDNMIGNLSLNVEFLFLRLYSMLSWGYFFLILTVASAATGYMKREIKKHGFDYSSPLRHGLARKWIYLTPLSIYLLAFIPIALHPYLFVVFFCVFALSVSSFIGNTIKRV